MVTRYRAYEANGTEVWEWEIPARLFVKGMKEPSIFGERGRVVATTGDERSARLLAFLMGEVYAVGREDGDL